MDTKTEYSEFKFLFATNPIKIDHFVQQLFKIKMWSIRILHPVITLGGQ